MQSRILVLTLLLLTLPAFAQSDQQLVDTFDRAYAAERFDEALRAGETICERYPTAAVWHFNTGALHARLGHTERALECLNIAADNGYTGIRSFQQSTDLDPIRDLPQFTTILEAVAANAAKRLDEFKQLALAHDPPRFVPARTDPAEKLPVIIALHGTGMKGADMLAALEPACKDARVILIAPDALRPAGEGFSWTFRDEAEWFIDNLIERAVKEHNADPARVILLGFSQGANIALVQGQTRPDKFLAVVPICGHYEPQAAQTAEGQTPAPFYLITGSRDEWKKTYTAAVRDFSAAKGEVSLRVLTGKGHQLPIGSAGTRDYTRAIRWCLARAKSE